MSGQGDHCLQIQGLMGRRTQVRRVSRLPPRFLDGSPGSTAAAADSWGGRSDEFECEVEPDRGATWTNVWMMESPY
jgi:hypothetical protein